jgi:Ankyrin repeats (many copies)
MVAVLRGSNFCWLDDAFGSPHLGANRMDLGTGSSDGGFFAGPRHWCHSFHFSLLLLIWTSLVIVLTLKSKIRKREIAPTRLAALVLAVSLLVLGELPDGFWQRIFISRMATSPRAGDLLVYAAYRGDLGTVRGFILHGVPVDAIDHAEWRTALHGAAIKGDTRTLHYLASKGANINALDRFGDSPLELAASRGNQKAVEFLVERGAKRIRGDEAQRQKAIHDIVQDDIRQLNRTEGLQR